MYEKIEVSVKNLQAAQQKLVAFLDIASIEALIILFEIMLGQTDNDWESLSHKQQQDLKKDVQAAKFSDLQLVDRRQVLQFLLVNTIHQDGLQANYQVTPDAIGMWIAFIAEKFTEGKTDVHLKEIAVGTGNLLATISQALQSAGKKVHIQGFENDDTMLTVASGVAALLNESWQLTLTDGVTTPMTGDADIIIGDLPIGYYPKEVPKSFVTRIEEGLTFVHHLLIEQSVAALKPGGLAILTVPSNLFESDQSKKLLSYLQTDEVYFQSLIQLPSNLFKDSKLRKVILILQRSGADAVQAKPVMLARTPELSNEVENKKFVTELTAWMTANHLYN